MTLKKLEEAIDSYSADYETGYLNKEGQPETWQLLQAARLLHEVWEAYNELCDTTNLPPRRIKKFKAIEQKIKEMK